MFVKFAVPYSRRMYLITLFNLLKWGWEKNLSTQIINLSEVTKYRPNNEIESWISKNKLIKFIAISENHITSIELLKSNGKENKLKKEESKGELATTLCSKSVPAFGEAGVVSGVLLVVLGAGAGAGAGAEVNSRLAAIAPVWAIAPTNPAAPSKLIFWIGGKEDLTIILLAAAATPPIAVPNPIWLPVARRPEARAWPASVVKLILIVLFIVPGSGIIVPVPESTKKEVQ